MINQLVKQVSMLNSDHYAKCCEGIDCPENLNVECTQELIKIIDDKNNAEEDKEEEES
jgi:hypothetical protein